MAIEIEVVDTETGETRKIISVESNPFATLDLRINKDCEIIFVGAGSRNMLNDLQNSEEISRICLNGEEIFYFE